MCNANRKYEFASLLDMVRFNMITTYRIRWPSSIASEKLIQKRLLNVTKEKLMEGMPLEDVLEKIKAHPELRVFLTFVIQHPTAFYIFLHMFYQNISMFPDSDETMTQMRNERYIEKCS